MWSFWTSAIAHVGPIEKWPLYAYLYVAVSTFAELASAASTLPTFVVKRAGLVVFVSPACRSQLQKFPDPESFGSDFQTTFSCAAAWIASYSFGATTARKLLTCTTLTFGMCEIDFGSTLIGKWFCDVTAPCPCGRTTRACSIRGIRRLCTYVYVPVTLSGMSTRIGAVPRSLYCE